MGNGKVRFKVKSRGKKHRLANGEESCPKRGGTLGERRGLWDDRQEKESLGRDPFD